ncbi:MAG: FAD-dependent oxidoreductase [Candidatus Roseilinea sp.]|nr:MAG: FAD-dependent oxidoreductase [Candidatus Roseilinea sp.]
MIYDVDIAVIGGGMGGVAAALAACEAGRSVVLTEATDWLGGQMTSQGVSALDEHAHIEYYGGTRSYMALREAIRAHYRTRYGVQAMPDGRPLNPGDGWVSRLCFEPSVGLAALQTMLAPHVANGRLIALLNHAPTSAIVQDDRVIEVRLQTTAAAEPLEATIRARFFLDATELGDLLPLTGTAYVTGAESRAETGEPDAPPEARPGEVQSFTYCFAVECCPGEYHVIEKPAGYERMRDAQPYTLVLRNKDGSPRPFEMFTPGTTGLPFWTYRRLLSRALLDPEGIHGLRDLALINWNSNDYHERSIIDVSPEARAAVLDEARRLSLGFLYWLQTECPRDEGGRGYPELKLRLDVMGTPDGLSKFPYIRESRRIVALTRIVEQDILAALRPGARQAAWPDSVGVGWYPMDLHPAVGNPRSMFEPTIPFQIPLGALIPRRTRNLIAACKNIGTTHLTNGAYRLHPVEWNIGESAGALAAFCCEAGAIPRRVRDDATQLARFQERLRERGVPLDWSPLVGH